MVVQQPGMVERGLQDQGLAQRHRGARAAIELAGSRVAALTIATCRACCGIRLRAAWRRSRRNFCRLLPRSRASPAPARRLARAAGNCRAGPCAGAKNCRSRSPKSCCGCNICATDLVSGDGGGDFVACGLPAPRAVRAYRRSAPSVFAGPQHTAASGLAASTTSTITAVRPGPERSRSSGSWPPGSMANFRLLPGFNRGIAMSTARKAARTPALSPSKHSTGSSAIFHKSASWSSVSAVPSGATAAA